MYHLKIEINFQEMRGSISGRTLVLFFYNVLENVPICMISSCLLKYTINIYSIFSSAKLQDIVISYLLMKVSYILMIF